MTFFTGCVVCGSPASLFACPSCSIVEYCSSDHQIRHSQDHDKICHKVKEIIAKINPLDMSLLDSEADSDAEDHNHDKKVEIWVSLLDNLLKVNTSIAMDLAFKYVLHTHRRVKVFDPEIQLWSSAVLLLRNDHQLCYDSIYWYSMRDMNMGYPDPLSPNPFLELGASSSPTDVFRYVEIQNLFCVQLPLALARILWIHDLEDLENFKSIEQWLRHKTNYDATELIREHIVECEVLRLRKQLWRNENTALIESLKLQVKSTLKKLDDYDDVVWLKTFIAAVRGDSDGLARVKKKSKDHDFILLEIAPFLNFVKNKPRVLNTIVQVTDSIHQDCLK